MGRPRMRPLFKLELALPAPRLMAEIRSRLQAPRAPIVGTVLRRHVQLTVREQDRHFWSPHLNLDVFEEGDGSVLRGRYSPHPSLWTFVMAVYGVLSMVALAGTVYGASQLTLGWTPWGFAALPLAAAGAAATWLASAMGQRLAHAQMEQLHDFLSDCVHHASQPPPAPEPQAVLAPLPTG